MTVALAQACGTEHCIVVLGQTRGEPESRGSFNGPYLESVGTGEC